MKKSILVSLLALLMMGCQVSGGSSLKVEETTVEMRKNPEGVAVSAPRFSWQLVTDKQDVMQTAYQIEVADSEKGLQAGSGLVWNSGRVESGQSVLVKYAGAPLESGQKYWWRVTVWTNTGDKAQSSIQYWSMALLDSSDWKAGWIGLNDSTNLKLDGERTILPARYLRKEFDLPSQPKRAVLYVSGVGSSVCYMNGERIGNDVFGPLPTWYDASVSYLTYDVTPLLKSGTNTIGVALGNGRYLSMRANGMVGFGLPRLMAQLNIEYDNGETVSVVSDDSWKATNHGPITANNEFDGEHYDARLELGKWTESGYDDSGWQLAERMEAPKGKLVAQLSPSLKVMEEIKPISVKSVGDGRYIVDMGQNMVGIQQVKLRGKKDKPITMRFAEVLKDNGTELYLDNLRSALVTDIYTPAADGEFVWEPLFVYHGFRFMEISGLDYEPAADDFIGKVVYDEMATNGTFETSEELINRLHKNAYWGIRGNYRGMPPESPELIHSEDPARKTNGEVLSTTVFYSILQLMEKFAQMNGLPADAEEYAALAIKIKDAYNKKFFNPGTAQYDNNTVTANLLSLRLGLVPDGYEDKVFANVVEKTEKDCKGHVSAGVLGIQHLMRGLTEYGGLELAYKIVTNDTYPSWGYMIKKGATTIWELWNGDTANPAMNSRNHVMLLGDLLIWFYEDLAGIKNTPASVGFKQILMEPVFPEKLNYVNASHVSPYGRIGSSWKRDGNKLEWNVEIPANTTATVKLPLDFHVQVDAGQAGIHSVEEADGKLVVELGSGKYVFMSE